MPSQAMKAIALPLTLSLLGAAHSASTLAAPAPEMEMRWEQRAQHWIDVEFTPSTLTEEQQLEELKWFKQVAEPYQDMEIRVVSERIDTHRYESSVLAKAFYELTGIKVIHEITGEDDVIKKLEGQILSNANLYDGYINDSDLIGFHSRTNATVKLDLFMASEGADVTLPSLDLDDFIGLKFTTGADGHLYQLPDQQFANLYWYRADWFERKDLRSSFKQRYGYELGVPQNWAAYEDIAEFFTVHVREIDGERVWGHMDYGKQDPSLGWRISDAWLGLAGTGDLGLPNGLPVDEWGIRVEGCRPVGASVARGGALNSPATEYAIGKYVDWLKQYAPPEARNLNFTEAGNWLARGNIAQQIWWYSAFTAALTRPGTPIVNEDGTPKWRMAPSPHGAYWQNGMKLGYQDAGSWTFLKSTPLKRLKAAWLYAQFVVSKTVSLRKTLVGLTPIRKSDIDSDALTRHAHKLGGLVEFYRSKGRDLWTPTGTNVPNYTRLSKYWWQYTGAAVQGKLSIKEAVDQMAIAFDRTLDEIGRETIGPCSPRLARVKDERFWLDQPGAPKAKIDDTQSGITLTYEEAIRTWQ